MAQSEAPEAKTTLSFLEAVQAALSPEEQAAFRKWRWHDRLVSLWAPVTVLAIAFLAYLVVVESSVCTSLWLGPLMQGLGLICIGWWAALVIARFTLRKWNSERKARYRAEEQLLHIAAAANKFRPDLKDKAWSDLVETAACVAQAFATHSEVVGEASQKLEVAFHKHLAHFKKGGFLDLTSGFMRALLVALAFRALLIEPFKIPSGSMIPTLEIGDQIFVNKFIYGVRLPFTNFVPFVLLRKPQRGDVIVFNNPVVPEVDYVKRIIGVPGDRLEFTDDAVVLNGTALPMQLRQDPYIFWDQPRSSESMSQSLRNWFSDDWYRVEEALYRETIDGQPHAVLENKERRRETLSQMRERIVVVPEGAVFVMGDNRNHSLDGRFGLGGPLNRPEFVPYGNIKGKAMAIWLSLGHGGLFSSIFGGTGIRYDRFFRPVTLCPAERAAPRVSTSAHP